LVKSEVKGRECERERMMEWENDGMGEFTYPLIYSFSHSLIQSLKRGATAGARDWVKMQCLALVWPARFVDHSSIIN